MSKKKPTDAWEQYSDIRIANTHTWQVRRDLRVIAKGVDRGVALAVGAVPYKGLFGTSYLPVIERDGNVRTMRELAYALLAACDAVEAANPTWAEVGETSNFRPPETFKV